MADTNALGSVDAFRPCPYCEGDGCEECDGTGKRFRQSWTTDDGVAISVSGSGAFNQELVPLFEELANAASVHLERTREDS
jgi:hypothetical protein